MRLALVGDVMLGRNVNQVLQHETPDYPWGDTLPLLQTADVRICNLECVISDIGQPWSTSPKVFHFRTDEKNIEVLDVAGFAPVAIANNHVLDYEYEALLRMTEVLGAHAVPFAGAGANAAAASAPALHGVGEMTIGLIACTDNEPEWEAAPDKPGIFYVPIDLEDQRAGRLLALITSTRDAVDLLVVSLHWGPNWGYRPPAEHIPFAKALVDAGADIVSGHSCHVFQGVEIYKGRPILYATGDFVDDYAVDEIERNDQSFVFVVTLEGSRISGLRLYPTVIRNMQARRARDPEASAIVGMMRRLCDEFATPSVWCEEEGFLEIPVQ